MAEYIEREAALVHIKENQCKKCSDIGLCGNCAVLTAVKLFESIPAADVRPVVRGKWVLEYEPNGKPYCFHCSVCDGDFHYIGITTKYDFCPNCGADMRETPKKE